MKLIIEGETIKNKQELYSFLKEHLQFPAYYGNNLDALWDCLKDFSAVPLTIEWRNFNTSKNFIGDYADKVAAVLEEAQQALEGFTIIIDRSLPASDSNRPTPI